MNVKVCEFWGIRGKMEGFYHCVFLSPYLFSAVFTLEVLFGLLFNNLHFLIMFVFCSTFFTRWNILQYLVYLSFLGILLIDVPSGYRSYFPAFLNAYNF